MGSVVVPAGVATVKVAVSAEPEEGVRFSVQEPPTPASGVQETEPAEEAPADALPAM